MLRMKTVKGTTVVYENNTVKMSVGGEDSISHALHYVFIKKFMSKVDGTYKPYTYKPLHPVKSLLPSTTAKNVKFTTT